MTELTQTQARRRKHLETEIQSSANTMGTNLQIIHDEGLYKSTHATWEAYCKDVWGIGRSRAYQLLQHGKVLMLMSELEEGEMSTIVDIDDPSYQEGTPDSQSDDESEEETEPEPPKQPNIPEAATRALIGLPDDVAAKLLRQAVNDSIDDAMNGGNRGVTAKAVKALRAQWEADNPSEDEEEVEAEPEMPSLDDAMKSHNKVVGGLMLDLGRVYKTAETYGETNGWFDKNRLQELNGRVQSAKNTLRAVKAADSCPYCDGNGCDRCRQTGYVNKTTLDAAPEK